MPEKNIRKELRIQFEKKILSKPIIIDNDFDAHLCLAYIHTKLKKKINVVGIKDRERERGVFESFGLKGTALMIKSTIPWKKCSFIDFEVHGCPSIGQHMLLKWDEDILNPNKEINVDGEKDLGHKYPMNTIIYIMYLYDDLKNYSNEQWKYIAIPDKTYQNSWSDEIIYYNPEPKICSNWIFDPLKNNKRPCNSRTFKEKEIVNIDIHGRKIKQKIKVCYGCGYKPVLRSYRKNFMWWEEQLKFPIKLHKILDDKKFYDGLYEKFPHIYGKYPDMDKKGMELLGLILKKLKWNLPTLPKEKDYRHYYLIPEYRMVPLKERVPSDVFHHARLDIRNMWISRKSEIMSKNLKN